MGEEGLASDWTDQICRKCGAAVDTSVAETRPALFRLRSTLSR